MSVYPRVLAFYTAALAALLIVGTSFLLTPVAASPVPFPLVTYFAREYVANPVQDSHSDSMLIRDFFANSSELTLRRTNDTLVTTRDINTFVGNIGILNNYYMEMADHASKLRMSLLRLRSLVGTSYTPLLKVRYLLNDPRGVLTPLSSLRKVPRKQLDSTTVFSALAIS